MPDLLNPGDQEALGAPPAKQNTTTPTPADFADAANKGAGKPAKISTQEMIAAGKVGDLSDFFMKKFKAVLLQFNPGLLQTIEREIALADVFLATTDQGRFIRKECRVESIFAALLVACSSGLSLANKEYAFVPYGDKVQFQMQYQGFLKLVRNYGDVAYVSAEAVHEGDQFDFELGLDPILRHRPMPGCSQNSVTYAYCVVHYKSGMRRFVVMDRDEIERLRKINRSQKASPGNSWADHYGQMACAKVIKRATKTEPMALNAPMALRQDGAVMELNTEPIKGAGMDGFVKAEFADE